MKTVSYEEFLKLDPRRFCKKGCVARIKACFKRFGGSMSALDILTLANVSAEDKLWVVLLEEFIPAPTLHEFACVCAEYALTLVNNPDQRSIKVIEVKRAWLRGEATDEELVAAWDAARAAPRAAWVAWATASDANDAAWAAATASASSAARAAATWASSDAAWAAENAWNAVCEAQVAYLIMVLEEEK